MQLKINAQNRFCLILVIVLRLRRTACTSVCKSFLTRTISAASTAISVPLPIAKPISAVTRAGASLIPSPTMPTTRPLSCNSFTLLALS